MTNRDPYDNRGINQSWSAGGIGAAIIAALIVIGAIVYGVGNHSQTASNPGPSNSPPSTVGQGGGTSSAAAVEPMRLPSTSSLDGRVLVRVRGVRCDIAITFRLRRGVCRNGARVLVRRGGVRAPARRGSRGCCHRCRAALGTLVSCRSSEVALRRQRAAAGPLAACLSRSAPIRCIRSDCCARATNGQATAMLPSAKPAKK